MNNAACRTGLLSGVTPVQFRFRADSSALVTEGGQCVSNDGWRRLSIARCMKIRIKDWLQYIQQSLLHYSITDRRNAEKSHSAISLGYFNPPDRQRVITLILQFRQKLSHIGIKGFSKIFDGLTVYSGSSIR